MYMRLLKCKSTDANRFEHNTQSIRIFIQSHTYTKTEHETNPHTYIQIYLKYTQLEVYPHATYIDMVG